MTPKPDQLPWWKRQALTPRRFMSLADKGVPIIIDQPKSPKEKQSAAAPATEDAPQHPPTET